MINKKYIRLMAFASALSAMAFIPRTDDPLKTITEALHQWFDDNPQEKVYLHTDKPYYLIGDTIWLKGYVTVGAKHRLSGLSGALYVDLISEGDSISQSLKLPVTAGIAIGNFILHDTLLREGNYRIRAYTQWMRNAGPDYFYDRTFTVGNSVANSVYAKIDYIYDKKGSKTKTRALLKYTDLNGRPYADKKVSYQLKETYQVLATGSGTTNQLGELLVSLPDRKPDAINSQYLLTKLSMDGGRTVPKTFPIKAVSTESDVQFFPESGNLVVGIKSKVAFKATGSNGLGMAVKGTIVDSDNKEIAQLEAKHLGMGVFYLTPEINKTYSAKITYPDGSTNTIKLPEAQNTGYVLSAHLSKDSVFVRINKKGVAAGNLLLIGQLGGEVFFSEQVPDKGDVASLYFPIADVPSGIMQFTLFTAAGTPLNERVVFIRSHDHMNVKVSTAKPNYKRGEKVELNIKANTKTGRPLMGNFSVSVISEGTVPSDEVKENSIFAQLLLSADIKGYVEKPNYYFHNENEETKANLDILMLTQGYRRFAWKSVLAGGSIEPKYKAENLVSEISGTLTTLVGNKPLAGGKVVLLNNKTGALKDTVSDAEGKFRFANLFIQEGVTYTVQGRSATNSNKIKTTLDQYGVPEININKNAGDVNADIPKLVKASVDNSFKQELELQKNGKLTRVQQLNEVSIRGSKPRYNGYITEAEADEVFTPDARMPCATLKECLEEMSKSRIRWVLPAAVPCWLPVFGNRVYAVLINGQLIEDHCEYQSIILDDMSNISKVFTSHESPAMTTRLLGPYATRWTTTGPPPVIAIYTKNPNWRDAYHPAIVSYDPQGFSYAKQFYSPKYQPGKNIEADLRSTIYWNAVVLTDASGQSHVSYDNADQTGTYRVTVEGVDIDGRLGRQVFRYTVE